jgi:HlyD family secretion protein
MRLPSRPILITLAVVVTAAAAFLAFRGHDREVQFTTAVVDRGDIVDVVGATGTLQAVTTVQVGSQVSGTIASLNADFNSRVRKGQVVARLDPSIFEARLSQARANLVAARANVEKARATVEDTKQKYDRARELAEEKLLPASELETAKSNHEGAVANQRASQAAVSQAQASVEQAQVDLTHTVITAPIDGVVVARNVDVGQTVAASLQAPTLFVIANDLTRMQVSASIDEADIGRVRAAQDVTFHVDAYPNETFTGTVDQIRLQPITVQNVVTYNTIIAVDNPGQRLMPGMTATVSVIVQRRDDVLRIPAAALRFRPEGWEGRGGGRRAGAGGSGAPNASGAGASEAPPTTVASAGAPATTTSAAPASPAPAGPGMGVRGPRGGGPEGQGQGEGRRRRWAERGGAGPGGRFPGGGFPEGGFRGRRGPREGGTDAAGTGAAGPRAERERGAGPSGGAGDAGGAWRMGGGGRGGGSRPTTVFLPGPEGKPKPQPIRTGISDGQYVEVVDGLQEGAQVITGTAGEAGARPGAPRPGGSGATNPFAPQPQRRQR